MNFQYLSKIRQQNPLVHNITNLVSAHFTANGLLAIGASPFMSSTLDEMSQVPAIADALVINMGALSITQVEAMLVAGKAMNELGKPVVLDPVGAGATAYRQQIAKKLLSEIRFSAIRGNAGEVAFLAGVDWQAKGVDAGCGHADVAMLAKDCANRYGCVVAVSGAVDYVSDGDAVFTINNGTPMFPKITASGCLLAGVCGAFLAVANPSEALQAVVAASGSYAVAGELAAARLEQTQLGQFYVGLMDCLGEIDDDTVAKFAKIDEYQGGLS